MSLAVVARCSLVALGLGFGAAVAGCGAGPGESLGESSSALTSFPNDQAAFDYFLGKGLTNYQAAGIVGNLDQESGVDPTAVQSGGPGRGIAQWSVGGRWTRTRTTTRRGTRASRARTSTPCNCSSISSGTS